MRSAVDDGGGGGDASFTLQPIMTMMDVTAETETVAAAAVQTSNDDIDDA